MYRKQKSPILNIWANPPAYGQVAFDSTNDIINEINQQSKIEIDQIKINGSHHFHMIQPEETANIILNYLSNNNLVIIKDTNNNESS
jgi:alpha/beta superfamily hydrolase